MDQEVIEVDATYEFDLEEITTEDYRCSKRIVEWLQSTLSNVEDAKGRKVFSKVNYGYNEETIKSFGKKPVADVYINNSGYETDFQGNRPVNVTSFIICYLKGNMNATYLKACELNDFLTQKFMEDTDFRELENVVKTTYIRDNAITIIPSGKTYGVLCAFELEHELY